MRSTGSFWLLKRQTVSLALRFAPRICSVWLRAVPPRYLHLIRLYFGYPTTHAPRFGLFMYTEMGPNRLRGPPGTSRPDSRASPFFPARSNMTLIFRSREKRGFGPRRIGHRSRSRSYMREARLGSFRSILLKHAASPMPIERS